MNKKYIMQYILEHCPEAQDVVRFLCYNGKRVLFGCGEQSRNFTFLMSLLVEPFDGYIVTTPCEVEYLGKPVFAKENYIKDVAVMIAVNENVSLDIKKDLQYLGYKHVFATSNWEKVNDIVKEAVFLDYCNEKNISIKEKIIHLGACIFYNPFKEERAYRQMFFGTSFSQMILPGIMYDTRYANRDKFLLCERLAYPGEVAFEIGANAGIFAGYLASLGWKVVAFDPSKSIRKYLIKNVELYPHSIMEEKAISGRTGLVDFYDVTDYPKYSSVKQRSNATKYVVYGVTLDDYICKNDIYPRFIHIGINESVVPILLGGSLYIKSHTPDLLIEETSNNSTIVIQCIKKISSEYLIVCEDDWIYAYQRNDV